MAFSFILVLRLKCSDFMFRSYRRSHLGCFPLYFFSSVTIQYTEAISTSWKLLENVSLWELCIINQITFNILHCSLIIYVILLRNKPKYIKNLRHCCWHLVTFSFNIEMKHWLSNRPSYLLFDSLPCRCVTIILKLKWIKEEVNQTINNFVHSTINTGPNPIMNMSTLSVG